MSIIHLEIHRIFIRRIFLCYRWKIRLLNSSFNSKYIIYVYILCVHRPRILQNNFLIYLFDSILISSVKRYAHFLRQVTRSKVQNGTYIYIMESIQLKVVSILLKIWYNPQINYFIINKIRKRNISANWKRYCQEDQNGIVLIV